MFHTPIRPAVTLTYGSKTRVDVTLDPSGMLVIYDGFMWDGASGPSFDDSTNQQPALIHDALYALMAHGLLDLSCRKAVDELFYQDLLGAGMSRWRAWYYYKAVRWFGKKAASTPHDRYRIHSC